MIPNRGAPWSRWELQPDDFSYLYDDAGNGHNLVSLSLSWFNLLGSSPVDADKPYRVCSSFYRDLSWGLGLKKIIQEYKALGNDLLQGLLTPREGEHRVQYTDPLFRRFAATPVFREYRAFVRTGNPEILGFLTTFLMYGKKADYINPDLRPKALDNWVAVEEDLRTLDLPEHVLEDLRRLVALSGFKPDMADFWPKHGKKQVAERLRKKNVHRKNKVMQWDEESLSVLLDALIAGHGRYADQYVLPRTETLNSVEPSLAWNSEWELVVKDEGSMRSIGMEPTTKMYLQQGLLRVTRKAVDRSVLSQYIDIEDQTKNQQAALRASEGSGYATLDLKDASDRVSWQLIAAIFPEEFVSLLDRTRTRSVNILSEESVALFGNATIVQLCKAFPMGSAMCFIIQCIVFACITALANVLRTKGYSYERYLSEGMSIVDRFPSMGRDVRTYGDDMILEDRHVPTVISLLERLGFRVNRTKSFSGRQAVRESCGLFAWLGHRIDPILFKVKGLRKDLVDSWLGVISLANRFYDIGYLSVRDSLKSLLPQDTYIETDSDSPYILSAAALKGNATVPDPARDRWNPWLHRWERYILTREDVYSCFMDIKTGLYSKKNEQRKLVKALTPLVDYERYEYGQWLYECRQDVDTIPSYDDERRSLWRAWEKEWAEPSPRNDLTVSDRAVWVWTPYESVLS